MLFLREIFSQCFLDILSLKLKKNLSALSFQMPSLIFQVVVRFHQFILCCSNGFVYLIEVEGMLKKKKKGRESQALLSEFSG